MPDIFEFHRQLMTLPGAPALLIFGAVAVVVGTACSSRLTNRRWKWLIFSAAAVWFFYGAHQQALRLATKMSTYFLNNELLLVPLLYAALVVGTAAYAATFREGTRV